MKHDENCPCFGDTVEHAKECGNCDCPTRTRKPRTARTVCAVPPAPDLLGLVARMRREIVRLAHEYHHDCKQDWSACDSPRCVGYRALLFEADAATKGGGK